MALIYPHTRHGFTLLELSIVLVIIGLLAAGIVAGRELILAAKTRSVISDVQNFKTAIGTFKEKYLDLPGDMPDGQRYWPGIVTFGGNGDGQIGPGSEHLTAWQELSLSKVIPGNYSGELEGPGDDEFIFGENVPGSKIELGGYWLRYKPVYTREGNLIQFGSKNNPAELFGSVVNVTDAINIDNKMDDGVADAGNVYTENGQGISDCISGTSYTPSTSTISCRMYFWID